MYQKTVVSVLITAALSIGLTACGDDPPPAASTSAPAAAPAESVFGPDAGSDVVTKLRKDNATAIVEVVEERNGSRDQAIAALLAAEAETGWRSGLSMAPPSTDIRDIYGWRFTYNTAADSQEAVRAATNTFMDNAIGVSIDSTDAAAYALAVQRADRRGYNEAEHFYKNGESSGSQYAESLERAQSAYAELTPAS